jgi:hypothetical protein
MGKFAEDAFVHRIEALTSTTESSKIDRLIVDIAKSDLSESAVSRLVTSLAKKTGIKSGAINADIKRARTSVIPLILHNGEDQHLGPLRNLSRTLGKEFVIPTAQYRSTHLTRMDGLVWVCEEIEEGQGVARCTPFMVMGGIRYLDQENRGVTRIAIYGGFYNWTIVDIPASAFADATGREALKLMFDAGLRVQPQGRDFVVNFVSSVQLKPTDVVDVPSWLGDCFICPSGEAIPASAPLRPVGRYPT